MAYRVERSAGVQADLSLIFDFIFKAYQEFGNTPASAFDLAAERLADIENAMLSLAQAPHQGTLRPELSREIGPEFSSRSGPKRSPDIRSVTKRRAIFYFTVDDTAETIRVLAIFFGGQDHQRHMLKRLLEADRSKN